MSIPRAVLIAARPFGERLGAARVAQALARGLQDGGMAPPDLCSLEWDGRGRPELLAELAGAGFDKRMDASRALLIAEPRLEEATLRNSATFELATRARQGGVPCYAVSAHSALAPFDARMLDLQVVLEATSARGLTAAGRRLARLI